MHIHRAFCVELKKVVDIYEARDQYFRRPPPRKRFQFLCSDDLCRKKNNTKVTGVNYDKLVEEVEQFVKPHFRENTEHIPNCEWVELEIALAEFKAESGGQSDQPADTRRPRITKNLKSSNVVDIFVPSSAGGERVVEKILSEKMAEIKRLTNARDRIEAYKKYLKDNPNQTSVLESVVESYLMLAPHERRLARLKIDRGRWRTYWDCFRPINKYIQGRDENFIYFGNVVAKSFGPNFSLIFFDKIETEGQERQISLYIKKEKLDRFKHRAYLSEILGELVSRRTRYAHCYFYGRIRPSERNKAWLDIDVDHLNNLVVILK